MPFAAALSQHPLPTHATGEVVGQLLEALGDAPDAVLLFATTPFTGALEDVVGVVRRVLRPGALVGATAASVLAGAEEVEGRAALAAFAWRSPRARSGLLGRRSGATEARAVHLRTRRTPDGWEVHGDHDLAVPGATVVLLADPHSFPVDAFVAGLAERAPTLTVVGGLASGGHAPGGNRLVADDTIADGGAVALLLPPGLAAQAVVSQGCRPVGEPLVVTRASGNLIEELAGQPALDRLMAQADAATPADRSLMARGLHLGVVVDEHLPEFGRGDFLIRSVLGAEHQQRAVAVGAEVEVGTTVQFQVRDAASADEDLRDLLVDAGGRAALVFTCTGRGTALFDDPHHDAAVVHEHVEGGATAGMFCAGEIGPVGDVPFVHGFTASVLLLDDA